MDKLITIVLSELKSAHSLTGSQQWSTVYEQLVGAVFGLGESRFTIERRLNEMDRYANLVSRLRSLLQDRYSNSANLHKQDLEVWSSGFYLNKAQANIVSAVDRSLNLLLNLRLNQMDAERDLIWLGFEIRAQLLRALINGEERLDGALSNLVNGSVEYWEGVEHAGGKAKYWIALAKSYKQCSNLWEVYTQTSNKLEPQVAFHAIVHQVNWFKHHPKGAGEARRRESTPEPNLAGVVSLIHWSASLIALKFACQFAGQARMWDTV